MSLKQQIKEDMKIAMRQKEADRLATIRMLLSEIRKVEIDTQSELDGDKLLPIIVKMVKQREDSARIYQEANRSDMAEKELNEVATLQQYLPKQLSPEEVQEYIQKAIQKVNASSMADMGKVMGILKSEIEGQANMAEVSQLVKQALK